jgi:hypothetical protein
MVRKTGLVSMLKRRGYDVTQMPETTVTSAAASEQAAFAE